jgi:hypothetical protein
MALDGRGDRLDLPGGGTLPVADLDLGMRSVTVDGTTYAVVMDVHPPSRFLPEELVETLEAVVEPTDGSAFGIQHLMGLVVEEYPDRVAWADASDDGRVGFGAVWVSNLTPRELHRVVVELVVELMEHAVTHADDDAVAAEFEDQLRRFDVETFVDRYREERDFEDEFDTPA